MNILVVGAGLAGCTCARLLAEQDHQVHVIEATDHIGGICRDEVDTKHNCYFHNFGPHFFHTNDEWVWKFVNRFTKMRECKLQQKAYSYGTYYDFPLNLNSLEKFFDTSNLTEERAKRLMELKRVDTPPTNFEEAALNDMGEKLYKRFFWEYTRKQWQRQCTDLPISFYKRVPIRFNRDANLFYDKYQGVPDKGYTDMFKNMLDHENIFLYTETPFETFEEADSYDVIVYTGGFSSLPYRCTMFLDLEETHGEYPLVSLPDHLVFTRKTNFTLLHPLDPTKECRSYRVCYEMPQPDNSGTPLLPIPTEENCIKYMQAANNFMEKHKRCLFIGRLATYSYLNMDETIKQCAERLHVICK
jgi:UDP-galactopyranose mutase